MTSTEHPLVIGVFQDHTQAAQAIDDLHSAGFRDEKIRMKKMATVSGLLDRPTSKQRGHEAESRTLPDELLDKGMSQDEANYYQQEFEAGHSIVIVETHEHQQDARSILQRHGAYNVNTSVEQTEGDHIVPVREEVLQTHKQMVQIGEVVIRKEIITEEKTITVSVSREKLVIERLTPSSQPSGQLAQEREKLEEALKDGGTLRVILHEEQVQVQKYPVVKEEIFISKQQIEEIKHLSDEVKREEVHIEQVGNVHIQGNKGNPVSD